MTKTKIKIKIIFKSLKKKKILEIFIRNSNTTHFVNTATCHSLYLWPTQSLLCHEPLPHHHLQSTTTTSRPLPLSTTLSMISHTNLENVKNTTNFII